MNSTVYPTESFRLYGEASAQLYHIDIALPADYYKQPDKTWPVAYVLDGNLMFHLAGMTNSLCARDTLEPGIPSAIVVGIGYPDPDELSILRVKDYTPPGSVDDWFADIYKFIAGRKAESGGAPEFLDFILKTLHPEILAKYRVAGDSAALFGDSYGGLFTYYAFTQQAPLFDRYWFGSPGIFGAGENLLDELIPRLKLGVSKPTRIALTLGETERNGSIKGTMPLEMYQVISNSYDRIINDLHENPVANLEFAARQFEDETHVTVLAPGFTWAWRYLMRAT